MKTIYGGYISNKLTSEYLEYLTNKVFALLPMFEEKNISDEKYNSFEKYQKTIIQTINGNVELMEYNSIFIIDILSHLQALLSIDNHDDYKRHILKACKLLNKVRSEVENQYGL